MPQDVIDKATGQVTQVPDEQLGDLWKAGRVQLIGGKSYQLQGPDGTYLHAKAEQVGQALQRPGVTFASREAAQAEANEKAYGGVGGATVAALGGAASGLTLGISDELLPESWKQGLKAREKQNPTTTMLATGAGAAGLAALTGGASAAEEAGAAATSFLGDSVLAKVAQRAVAGGLRDAVAGAQYGLGQAISDDAFGDHKLTAEHVLSSIGGNALWGGAIGAGLGGLGAGLHGLLAGGEHDAPALASALAKSPTDEDVAKIASTITKVDEPAEGLGGKLRNWYVKLASAASGTDPEKLATFLGPEGEANRAALLEADATRDQAMRDIRTHGDNIIKASKDVEEIWQRGMKRSFIASSLEGVDADVAAQRARSLADHAITTLNGMIDDTDKFGDPGAAKATLTVAHQYSHKLDAAIKAGDVGEMYGLTDDLKKAIAKPTAKAANLFVGAQPTELHAMQLGARQQAWKDLHAAVQVGLEDQGVWGKMGEAQANVNKAYTNLIDARKRFNSSLVTDIGRDPNDLWSKAYGIDPAKVGGYVRGLMDPAKDLTHQAVQDYLSNSKLLAQTFADHFELPAGKLANVQKIASSTQAFQDTLDRAAKSLSLVNQFEHVRSVASGNGAMLGAGLGMMAHGLGGGIAGMALGKIAGVFRRPADTIMQLATVEKMARESEGRVGSALRAFGLGKQSAASIPSISSFARKADQVRRMVSDPETLATRIGQNTQGIRSRAPRLADAMTDTTLAGLAILRDKLPPSLPGDPLDPHYKPPPPPPGQQERWLRYYEAVKDPDSVVESLRDGRVSMEGVEVLQNVYPAKYAQVQQITYQQMAEGKLKNLGHQQRIGLGLLLQLPTDPTLDPGYIAQRQAAFQEPPTPDNPQGQQESDTARPRKSVNLTKGAPSLTSERLEAGPTAG